jgi:hypothetical protein
LDETHLYKFKDTQENDIKLKKLISMTQHGTAKSLLLLATRVQSFGAILV